MLLDHEADVDAHGDCGVRWQPTPLHVAARWGGLETITLLLDHGADIHLGGTGDVLNWVLAYQSAEMLELLFQRGLDLQHPACHDALHQAAASGAIAPDQDVVRTRCECESQGQTRPNRRSRGDGKRLRRSGRTLASLIDGEISRLAIIVVMHQ